MTLPGLGRGSSLPIGNAGSPKLQFSGPGQARDSKWPKVSWLEDFYSVVSRIISLFHGMVSYFILFFPGFWFTGFQSVAIMKGSGEKLIHILDLSVSSG